MFSFNLIEKKWLTCVLLDNSLKDLSLKDVLTDAASIRELIGDSPPVTIALHRLLLAILHRALNAPQNYEDWNDFWQAKSWNKAGKLDKYLVDWKHRFDLFDETRPFYQASTVKDSVQNGAIIQLYFQAKANATLFEHSTTSKPNQVSSAEAARLLITFQGFDVGGIKADGAGGKRSPLLNSAIGLVRGKNLFETLMLNLHCYNENDDEPFPFAVNNDLPAWERETETENIGRKANGYVDLLTWQSRRILLQPERNEDGEIIVKNTVIMKGLFFPNEYELYNKETMMAFGKSKKEGFYSVGFNENKALWRDSLSLFQTIDGEQYRPKILNWLNELVGEGFLERSNVFPIEFYGLRNDSTNEAKLLFWQQDRFYLPLAYLNDNKLLNKIKIAIIFSDHIGETLNKACYKLALLLVAPESDRKDAKSPDGKSVSNQIKSFAIESKYWASLEVEFKKLLRHFPEKQDEAMRDWFRFVNKRAEDVLNDAVKSLSGSATELKAVVNAQGLFNGLRGKLLKTNSIYQELLPNYKTKGGSE